VETSKKAEHKIRVPVLFGLNGKLEKSFEADAYHEAEGFVVEVEAGRGVVNNQFLKDLFQACMMHNVSTLAIAVRNAYRRNNDFEYVVRFGRVHGPRMTDAQLRAGSGSDRHDLATSGTAGRNGPKLPGFGGASTTGFIATPLAGP
jgi:hypothetical protein